MSARACDYYPDPPVCDYEPEYSRPADMSWLNNCRPFRLQHKPAEVKTFASPISLVPHRDGVAVSGSDFSPQLTVIAGGKSSKAQSANKGRRDGTSVVVECAAALEWACHLFKIEANERAILDVEPHLRRVTRAANQLTREAARVRRKQASNEPDDNNLLLETDIGSNDRLMRIPIFNDLHAAVENLRRRGEE